MKKIVITGGLAAGKTTTLKVLEELGYKVVYEVSNSLIDDHQRINGLGKYPWSGGQRDSFQKKVLEKQLERESELNPSNQIVFLDRGVPDGIPFYMLEGLKVPKVLWKAARKNKYEQVFFMESLPPEIYCNDTHRPQTPDLAKEIESLLFKIYCDLGYSPIKIPLDKPSKRADFILKEVEKYA